MKERMLKKYVIFGIIATLFGSNITTNICSIESKLDLKQVVNNLNQLNDPIQQSRDYTVYFSEIFYHTSDDINDEYIELYIGEGTGLLQNLGDWYITTYDSDDEYLFDVYDLEQFDYVAIFMGTGISDFDASDGSATLYLDRDTPMLDQPGDEVGLYDADGVLIDFVRYGGGNGDPVLGGWSLFDQGVQQANIFESIQIHGDDGDNSTNWISAPPSTADPNVDEWLMDVDFNLFYMIHNGANSDINLSGNPWNGVNPDWEIFNESGPVSNEVKNTVREWLNHTYQYMKSRGLGTAKTNSTDNRVHVHIQQINGPSSGRATRNGDIYVKIGNLSDRNESILSKQTVEHEHVHLIQYNNSGTYGPYNDWTDLEGMAEYWGTNISMDNFGITFEEFLEANDNVLKKYGYSYRHYSWLNYTDNDYFGRFRYPAHLNWYWANHMFLRWIALIYGGKKVEHIFRVRNASSGITGIINATNRAFEEQADHNETFEDLFENFTLWLWKEFRTRIRLALNRTFDGSTNITESGTLEPWGTDYERISNPTDNGTIFWFNGTTNVNYSITIIVRWSDGTYFNYTRRFNGSCWFWISGSAEEIIIIKRQLDGTSTSSYDLKVIPDHYNLPPYIVSNPIPPDGSSGVPVFTTLSWQGGDPNPEDMVYYEIYLGDDPEMLTLIDIIGPFPWNQIDIAYDISWSLEYDWTYYWQIIARDMDEQFTEGPIWQFSTEESINYPPEIPLIPEGPIVVYATFEYDYSTMTTDPEGHDVYYMWDWGYDITDWLGPFESGDYVTFPHIWQEPALYEIRIKAKDIYDAESDWSESIDIFVKKPGDIDGNGVVNVLDLLDLLASWGEQGGPADINGDGIVNVLDLLILLGNWG